MPQNLLLNREKIKEAIQSFHKDSHVEGPVDKGNTLFVYTVKVPRELAATINVYFKKDATTTLVANTGKNQELSAKICEHIITQCKGRDIPTKILRLKSVTEDNFKDLIGFLEGSCATITIGSNIPHGKQVKVTSTYGDSVFLNHYKTGNFTVQGTNKKAKALVIEGLTNFLPFKELIDVQLESLDVNIDSGTIVSKMQQILPQSYTFLGDTLIAIISPSVALNSINIELLDYSAFAFPALRGLEGYIKKLMSTNGIVIANDGFGNYFNMDSGSIKVTELTKKTIKDRKVLSAIEKAYRFYRNQRHTIFHVDGTIEATRILENKIEAEGIIDTVFSIIEETYSNIVLPTNK